MLLNIFVDFIDFFKDYYHTSLREALVHFVGKHDVLTYVLLCTIVFCETGLVITPFLPGDSLLFSAGAVAATVGAGILNPMVLMLALVCAAILGDHVNYFVGKFIGKKSSGIKFLGFTVKQEYLDKTHDFYEKYGGKTLILARFVPIVRTFAPFVAGLGRMNYIKFLTNCFIGGVFWVFSITSLGYFLGSFDFVQKYFDKFVIGIVLLSLLPVFIQIWKVKFGKTKNTQS